MPGPEGQVDTWHIELRERDAAGELTAPPADEEDAILSLGELRVLEMLARNLSNKEIAERLGVSISTVKFHLSNAFRKTGAANRADLVHRTADILNGRTAK
jgi:DNA-binding CsgD family transcriptional regulator